MRRGFIFDHGKCVACNACNVACTIENGWNSHPRSVYTFNSEAAWSLPVINLSMACNHCETASCLNGCPAKALYRDPETGSVIVNEERCLGCKYCTWNCPYDAPKYDRDKKIVEKCNQCYLNIKDGFDPACTTACPTGALRFSEMNPARSGFIYSWFPEKALNPAIEFVSKENLSAPVVFPERKPEMQSPARQKARTSREEISLVIFTFLLTVSVALMTSSIITGRFHSYTIILLNLLAGISSLFHLGKKLRSWRALSNFAKSPLSREISAFILYFIVSSLAAFLYLPFLVVVSTITGLILLLSIDSVYIFSDGRRSIFFHSGGTFISGLLVASFISGSILPAVFLAVIKTLIVFTFQLKGNNESPDFAMRFFRLALLIITGSGLLIYRSVPVLPVIMIFLSGELIDRIFFYKDFRPVNINSLIEEQLTTYKNESKEY